VRRHDDTVANGAVGGTLADRRGNVVAWGTDAVTASCARAGGGASSSPESPPQPTTSSATAISATSATRTFTEREAREVT